MIESKSGGNSFLRIPFEVNNLKDTAFISLISGLMVCSTSKELAEEAIMQMNSGDDVRVNPGFSRVHMASGKNEDKIFVLFSNLPPILKNPFSRETGSGRQDCQACRNGRR